MSDTSLAEKLAQLREPFPSSQVGTLPQPYKKDSAKGTCGECGKYHGLPAMHLDFVGHGAVTSRLLEVDPEWTWEPMALDQQGLPALDRHGNLWIRLTICGVTRLGVGDGCSMKVLIGDAIRNAAMRFGVALDLWINGSEDEKKEGQESIAEPVDDYTPGLRSSVEAAIEKLTAGQKEALKAWFKDQRLPPVRVLTGEQCGLVIEHLVLMAMADEFDSGEGGSKASSSGTAGGDGVPVTPDGVAGTPLPLEDAQP